MLTLPLPLVVALVLGFLILRLSLSDRRPGPLLWLVGLCALQSTIIALAQYYQLPMMRLVQPITAAAIPGVAWLAFVASAVRGLRSRDAVHLIGPALALVMLVLLPAALDALIPALFLGYGIAIAWRCRQGPDALPRARLENGALPTWIWLGIAATLGLSALSDVLIVAAQSLGAAWIQPLLVSGFSALNLLLVGALSLSQAIEGTRTDEGADPVQADPSDLAVMEQLRATMEEARPYLDPDLSLAKLARKVGVPAKSLSAAINRSTGESVSRYINKARIEAAQALLLQGTSVTAAIYEAGFNTKSNFNREFLRVSGASPSAWLLANQSPG